ARARRRGARALQPVRRDHRRPVEPHGLRGEPAPADRAGGLGTGGGARPGRRRCRARPARAPGRRDGPGRRRVARAMIWWAAYLVLLAALVVRVVPPGTTGRPPLRPGPDEPLRLVTAHHALFYAILVGAPLEGLVLGGAASGRRLGVLLFAAGVALYRVAGRALGAALSPLVSPRPGAVLVTSGPYRYLRHPMYIGQALMALGAPLTLGCRW